ncbi:MAG: hypothetical protein Q7S27_05570 [Nanoarchaeota archaeon]|nr:hypothetical protein [Nanoarchaeota archaeon]
MSKIKLEDLHPVLYSIFTAGCELQNALEKSFGEERKDRIALNLTRKVEENPNKIIRYDNFEGRKENVYAIENIWRVHFGKESEKGFSDENLSMVFSNKNGRKKVSGEAGLIAEDLRKIYDLSYTPRVYINEKLKQNI